MPSGKKARTKRIWVSLDPDCEAKLGILQLALELDRSEVLGKAIQFYWRAMSKEYVLIALLRDDALAKGGS